MSGPDTLVERLTGVQDSVLAVDRLRLFAHDPETFQFDAGDADEVVEIIDEAAAELSALRERCVELEAENAKLKEWLEKTEEFRQENLRMAQLGIQQRDDALAARDEAVAALEEAREALRVIATGSSYEWSETREQLHRIIDAAVECASNVLTQPAGKEKG